LAASSSDPACERRLLIVPISRRDCRQRQATRHSLCRAKDVTFPTPRERRWSIAPTGPQVGAQLYCPQKSPALAGLSFKTQCGNRPSCARIAYREIYPAGNRANPQGCPAPSFREGRLMGPKCADACHAGRPQAALLWSHRETSPPPEIDEVAHLEANCSISE
jgi:hypothetical protein